MKTIKDFFEDSFELKEYLESRNGKTIHTEKYKNDTQNIYSDWKNVKPHLKTFIDDCHIKTLDNNFNGLIDEERKSRPKVAESKHFLTNIENIYVRRLDHQLNETNVEISLANSLLSDLETIEDKKYKDYLEEAVCCAQVKAYRGAVVLGWQAVTFALYKDLDAHPKPIHVAYQMKFKEELGIQIDSFWDFQKISDRKILILAESVGIIDKSLKDVLDNEKNIRNKAAHPGQFDVGPHQVRAFLENIIELLIKRRTEEVSENIETKNS